MKVDLIKEKKWLKMIISLSSWNHYKCENTTLLETTYI